MQIIAAIKSPVEDEQSISRFPPISDSNSTIGHGIINNSRGPRRHSANTCTPLESFMGPQCVRFELSLAETHSSCILSGVTYHPEMYIEYPSNVLSSPATPVEQSSLQEFPRKCLSFLAGWLSSSEVREKRPTTKNRKGFLEGLNKKFSCFPLTKTIQTICSIFWKKQTASSICRNVCVTCQERERCVPGDAKRSDSDQSPRRPDGMLRGQISDRREFKVKACKPH